MLILASGSPRRRELLTAAGIAFTVQPADVPEIQKPGEAAAAFASRVATEKARAVAGARPGSFVLAADTIVVVDGAVLGKPRDAADAARMLRMLSGREHEVTTGVCLIQPDGSVLAETVTTVVRFVPLTDSDVAGYIASGEPMDKAGAYAIQGLASRWIPEVRGEYANVVGLPIARVWKILKAAGAV
ncbi:MAG: septum formation inhibitor Maf [Acidobacteriales bacterium]|nr:septum formation inhibitor Maf [Terriglobales bacterium]